MKLAIASSILALGLVSFACKDDDDNDGQTIENIPNQLSGDYKTACTENSALGLTSSTRELSFSSVGDFDRKEVYFTNDNCTDVAGLTYRVVGTASVPGKLPENVELDVINFQIGEAYITPGNQALTDTLNATSFCGVKDWALNVEKSIADLQCNDFAIKKGEVIQDVYDDRDGTLFFGKKFALLLNEDDARPTEVDLSLPYNKQ
ncbi:MAG: hypothetical protein EOP04_05510 [Proteobacteria bacterium]|nr:MAG: hypothetical protein EOP04_05510 [Pseudomonadota bacterium]